MTLPVEGEFARRLLACQRELYAYLLSLVFDRDAAEDLLQQTNMVLCQKANEALQAKSFSAWAKGVARLEALAYRRRHSGEKLLFDNGLVELLAAEPSDEFDQLQERMAAARECLKRLPRRQQELVRDRYRPGARVKEIARRRRQTVEAVSKALYRARRALLACIETQLRKDAL